MSIQSQCPTSFVESWGKPNAQGRHGLTANTPAHTVYSHCVQHARSHRLQSLCTEEQGSEFNRDVLTTVLNSLSSPTLIIDFDYVLVRAHLEKQTYRVRPSPTLIIGFDYVLASVTFGETDIQSTSLHVSVTESVPSVNQHFRGPLQSQQLYFTTKY